MKSIFVECFQGKVALLRWPETGQLIYLQIISLIFGEVREPLNILKVGKSTVFERKLRNCPFKDKEF